MNGISVFVLAFALCLGTTALLVSTSHSASFRQARDAQLAADGAFRDGLYVGRLAAERSRPPHPPLGRWSSEKDRRSFEAGFRQAYASLHGGISTNDKNAADASSSHSAY